MAYLKNTFLTSFISSSLHNTYVHMLYSCINKHSHVSDILPEHQLQKESSEDLKQHGHARQTIKRLFMSSDDHSFEKKKEEKEEEMGIILSQDYDKNKTTLQMSYDISTVKSVYLYTVWNFWTLVPIDRHLIHISISISFSHTISQFFINLPLCRK